MLAVLLALGYLVWAPMSLDLAAMEYRAALFGRSGFAIWDLQWYAGHHVPGYSVLVPPLSFVLGPRLLGAVSAILAAVLFERLAWAQFGPRAWVGATWFSAGSVTSLISGRITFAVGLVPALAALVLLEWAMRAAGPKERRAVAVGALTFAMLTALSSPVAALFLALAGAAVAVAKRRPLGLALAAAAMGPVMALAVMFPEGGHEPLPDAVLAKTLIFSAATFALLPRRQRTLRVGVMLYALGCVALFLIPTPVGSNVVRLGALCAGPVLATVMTGERRRRILLLAALAPFLLAWQWNAAVGDLRSVHGDPTTSRAYFQPLLGALARLERPTGGSGATLVGDRVEIPFTRLHWESRWVAPHYPLARGWERQLDIADNAIFYDGTLSETSYRTWLQDNAVRWVALPSSRVDYSAYAEARLIASGLPYLRPVWSNAHWRLFEVRRPTALSDGPARVVSVGTDRLDLHATRPGTLLLRVRWTPYWAVTSGDGCVEPAGAWTRLRVRRLGSLRLQTRFDLRRIAARSPRCHGA